MPGPHVQTHFNQPAQLGSGRDANSGQVRTYSWVQTPVEMRHQQGAPEIVPPLPAMPDALRYTQRTPAPTVHINTNYPEDRKTEHGNLGVHPVQPAPYAETTPLRQPSESQMRWRTTPIPPSPGPLPTKADFPPSHGPAGVLPIAPDENPLTPTTPNLPQHTPRSPAYPPLAATGGEPSYHNHFPGQAPDPVQQTKGGTWKHGLCDCGDISTCCTGLFCPCILYGRTQYRLAQKSDRKDPSNMLGYETLNGSCAAFAVLCGCNWILAVIQHTRVRKNYDIPGSVGSDCVRGLCCCCCTLAQDEKEIKYRESLKGGFGGTATNTQYVMPVGMSYAPPPK